MKYAVQLLETEYYREKAREGEYILSRHQTEQGRWERDCCHERAESLNQAILALMMEPEYHNQIGHPSPVQTIPEPAIEQADKEEPE